MPLRHYVVTNRLVKPVSVEGQRDQYWYAYDGNHEADTATAFMRCGRYVDNGGNVDAPWFYSPEGEDEDYKISGKPNADQVKARGGSLQMLSELFRELEAEEKDLLIFNFGYENRQEKEFGHLTHLHNKYILSPQSNLGRVLMVTWPSQGFGEYNAELGREGFFKRIANLFTGKKTPVTNSHKMKSDVHATGESLAIFLLKLNNFIKDRYKNADPSVYRPKMHFIVQSMANSILEQCSRTLNTYGLHSELSEVFASLMLTSPDVRNDIFEFSPAYFNAAKMTKRAYVVCSEQDYILKLADKFHRIPGTKRLGLTGPSNMSRIPANVYTMNITQTKISFDPVDYNHRYFQYNAQVVDRYLHIFNEGETAREDKVETIA